MFSFKGTLGYDLHIGCDMCRQTLYRENALPLTGRCGHTICGDCHGKHILGTPFTDGMWKRCPIVGCDYQRKWNRYSFETQMMDTACIVRNYVNIKEAEEKVDRYCKQLLRKVGYMDLELNKEKLARKERRIEGMLELQQRQMEAMKHELKQKDENLQSIGFFELEELKEKLKAKERRITELEEMISLQNEELLSIKSKETFTAADKRTKKGKGRKVSMDNCKLGKEKSSRKNRYPTNRQSDSSEGSSTSEAEFD